MPSSCIGAVLPARASLHWHRPFCACRGLLRQQAQTHELINSSSCGVLPQLVLELAREHGLLERYAAEIKVGPP